MLRDVGMLRNVKVHVATSDFGQMGNPFSARSYRLSHAASRELCGQGDVRVGRNPGGSIVSLLGTQDHRLGSPPEDVTISFIQSHR
jgi:hypothetical protein